VLDSQTRIAAVLHTPHLDSSVTGFPSFDLSGLDVPPDIDFPLPTNLRLGHLIERIVSGLIKASSHYKVLYENIQISEDNITLGELDFIIEETRTSQILHLELAYKFYLYDPTISLVNKKCWIGPNRKDSLVEKLDKLGHKQFPLLSHDCTVSKLEDVNIGSVRQVLSLLVSLYVPYQMETDLDSDYDKYIKGYYLGIDTFVKIDHSESTYHFPDKRDWGIDPSENKTWDEFSEVKQHLGHCIDLRQAPLCWRKQHGTFSQFFIVWW